MFSEECFFTVSERNSARLIFHWSSEIFSGFNWTCSIKHNWLLINEYFLNAKPSNVMTKMMVTFWKWSINTCPIRILSKVSASKDDWRTPERRTGPDGRGISFDWLGSHWERTRCIQYEIQWIIPFRNLVSMLMVTNKIHSIFVLKMEKKILVLIDR